MASKFYLLSIFFGLISSILFVSAMELKLLHVLSANKFYVPDYNPLSNIMEMPKNLTYNYFLQHAVDVPNSVKMDLFNLGVHLRNRYDIFLGSVYTDEILRMQTTQFPVSIIAGELINAGLWPPVPPQIWKEDLAWQPIPFEYTPAEEDTLLLGSLCPNFEYETLKVLKTYNLSAEYVDILNYISKESHITVTNPVDVSLLTLALENSNELNQTRPEWASKIYLSEKLLHLSLSAYDLLSKTTVQKRLNGGSLIKTIIRSSKDYINKILSNERKINIYSGDERNLAGVFKNLDIPLHELPSSGAAIIFELYAEADAFFIKIVYYTGRSNETVPYALDGCELFCALDKFSKLVADVLPENELSLCGSMVENPPTSGNAVPGGASSNVVSLLDTITIFSLTLICTIKS